MTQVELKPGTYTLNPETRETFDKVVRAFKAAGFPEGNLIEDPSMYPLRDYFGWVPSTQYLELWNAPEHYGEKGERNFLTLDEVLSTLGDSEAEKAPLLKPGVYTDTPSSMEDFARLVQLYKDAGFPEDGVVEDYHRHRQADYFGWHLVNPSLQFWNDPEFFGGPDQRTYIPHEQILGTQEAEESREGDVTAEGYSPGYPAVGTTCCLSTAKGTHRHRILAYGNCDGRTAVMAQNLDYGGGLESYICEAITFLPDETPREKWIREAKEQASITSAQAEVLYSNMMDGYLEIPNPAED